jgi:hypothetical protein
VTDDDLLGKIAYEAHRDATGDSGTWEESLYDAERDAWIAAAEAVKEAWSAEILKMPDGLR